MMKRIKPATEYSCIALGLIVLLAASTAASSAVAHGGGGDIALFATGGQADVGFAVLDEEDINQIEFDPDVSVFQSILLPYTPNLLVPWQFASKEPGFDANGGELPGEAVIALNPIELQQWDGGGAVDFQAAPGISYGYSPPLQRTESDGGFHAHPWYGLLDAGSPVAEGVYLATMTVSVAGLDDSDPFLMVSLVDPAITTAEDAEALGEMVRDYLADPAANPAPIYNSVDYTYYADAIAYAVALIPEPSSMGLLLAGVAAVIGGRRRRD